jgi:hypothetical protein
MSPAEAISFLAGAVALLYCAVTGAGWLVKAAKARKAARRLPPPPPQVAPRDLPDPSQIPLSWLDDAYTSPAYRTDRGAEETSRYDVPDDWTRPQ